MDADIVPAFSYRLYEQRAFWVVPNRPQLRAEGIGFTTKTGRFPEQHYDNGVAKNERASRRFKRVVRILKRLRNHMTDNGISVANDFSSFLLEGLVYNCQDPDFAYDDIYLCVRAAIISIYEAVRDPEKHEDWTEMNEIKLLFSSIQPWQPAEVEGFMLAAWQYVEFPKQV